MCGMPAAGQGTDRWTLNAAVGPFNDWIEVGADYLTFFVHRRESTPRVNRLMAA